MHFSIPIFEIRSKSLLEAQSYLNVYDLFLMIVYMSVCWNIVLYVHLLIQLFEMSVSFHPGTVHYCSILSLSVCCWVHPYDVNTVRFFHCMILWHCVLWWLVILLVDKWPQIFLCWLSCFPVSKRQCTSWLFNHVPNGRTLCANLDWSILAFSL